MTKKIVITECPWNFLTVGKEYNVLGETSDGIKINDDDYQPEFIYFPGMNEHENIKFEFVGEPNEETHSTMTEVREITTTHKQPNTHPDVALQAIRDYLNDCGMELLRIKVLTQDNNIVKG